MDHQQFDENHADDPIFSAGLLGMVELSFRSTSTKTGKIVTIGITVIYFRQL
jgi:hypothetical protein